MARRGKVVATLSRDLNCALSLGNGGGSGEGEKETQKQSGDFPSPDFPDLLAAVPPSRSTSKKTYTPPGGTKKRTSSAATDPKNIYNKDEDPLQHHHHHQQQQQQTPDRLLVDRPPSIIEVVIENGETPTTKDDDELLEEILNEDGLHGSSNKLLPLILNEKLPNAVKEKSLSPRTEDTMTSNNTESYDSSPVVSPEHIQMLRAVGLNGNEIIHIQEDDQEADEKVTKNRESDVRCWNEKQGNSGITGKKQPQYHDRNDKGNNCHDNVNSNKVRKSHEKTNSVGQQPPTLPLLLHDDDKEEEDDNKVKEETDIVKRLDGQLHQALESKTDLLILHQELEKRLEQRELELQELQKVNLCLLEQRATIEKDFMNDIITVTEERKEERKLHLDELDDWERLHRNEMLEKDFQIAKLQEEVRTLKQVQKHPEKVYINLVNSFE